MDGTCNSLAPGNLKSRVPQLQPSGPRYDDQLAHSSGIDLFSSIHHVPIIETTVNETLCTINLCCPYLHRYINLQAIFNEQTNRHGYDH